MMRDISVPYVKFLDKILFFIYNYVTKVHITSNDRNN